MTENVTVGSRMSEQLVSELESFENILANMRNKLVQELSQFESEEDVLIQEHLVSMNNCKAMMNTIKEKMQQLHEKDTNKRKACEEAELDMNRMKTELDKLKEETDAILREKEMVDDKVNNMETDNDRCKEAISSQEKSIEQTAVELEKSAVFFSDRLGMKFKKISGGRLQVVMSCIDPKDPSKPGYFCVKINSDRTYDVTDCEPMVDDLDCLVKKLNTTNNFRSFIIELRKKFKLAV